MEREKEEREREWRERRERREWRECRGRRERREFDNDSRSLDVSIVFLAQVFADQCLSM